LAAKGEPATQMDFGTHFNPRLAVHSDYFRALDSMMQCAVANADVPDSQKE
jgi:hypothetical protein